MFRNDSKKLNSKGLTTEKAKTLCDLHKRREQTQGQFFTPEWVSKNIWHYLNQYIESIYHKHKTPLSVVDTSIGSARLFEGAPYSRINIYGSDIDSRCIDAIAKDGAKSGIEYTLLNCGIECLDVSGMDIAVINPPFSVQLNSATLTPYPCTKFGRLGANTTAKSHLYALEQALDGASMVVAILPDSMRYECFEKRELIEIINLPKETFLSEGANVKTSVYVFHKNFKGDFKESSWSKNETPKILDLKGKRNTNTVRFNELGTDEARDSIHLPVTGDNRVELHHHNRKIIIKFFCGLTEAKVRNGLLEEKATGKRLPKEIIYKGDGKLLLDVYLLQEDPQKSLEETCKLIDSLGGHCSISPTLKGYFKKLIKRHDRARTPMYRCVKEKGSNIVKLQAKRRTMLDPKNLKSASIPKGMLIDGEIKDGEYELNYGGQKAILRRDELVKRYDILNEGNNETKWKVKHKGLPHHFPDIAQQYETEIKKAGIDKWLAPFQIFSIVEGLINPYGYIGAWQQGSGKTRKAIAMALLSSGRSLIVVESGLLPEMKQEFIKLNIDNRLWKVLEHGDMPTAKVNITSYATMRQGKKISYYKDEIIHGEKKEKYVNKIVRTNADKWRGLINLMLCDEGGLLCNLDTQQTKAVNRINARKLICLDGTPQRNYARDMLPLSVATGGNGVAHQQYGVKSKAYLESGLINSANHCRRGVDEFSDNHVVTEWVTWQFSEELQGGAKREVPKIGELALFRSWLAPNIQRRLRDEPDLAIFKNCPDPIYEKYACEWDKEHLAHYLKVATEFAQWYRNQQDSCRNIGLISVLTRINAVVKASNNPHSIGEKEEFALYTPVTSKQRLCVERIKARLAEGRKVIVYQKSPDTARRLHTLLKKEGIEALEYTGKEAIKKRAKALYDDFRNGSVNVLLSTRVGQKGLNLPEASCGILYDRDWTCSKEDQAIYRMLRPEQKQQVVVDILELEGGIDSYQDQMVTWKRRCEEAGLDFGEGVDMDEEFLHLDSILQNFCSDILDMGVHEAKEALSA
ncbi:hypothetical protein A3715_19045 [Oleiphilus sp. HI0009]|nr:hypothetical protein A3715_19045 [Oleiphilus sp. HI0009]